MNVKYISLGKELDYVQFVIIKGIRYINRDYNYSDNIVVFKYV